VGYTGCLGNAIRHYVQEGFTTPSWSKMPLSSRVCQDSSSFGGNSQRVSSSYLVVIYLWSFKSLLVLCSVSCPAIRRKKLDDSEDARFLLDEMTPEHLLETETTGITAGSIRLAIPGDIQRRKHEN